MRIVVALGGNAMTSADGSARPQDQQAAVERTMSHIASLVAAGHEVVITHGNGPQVGNLLVKNEVAALVSRTLVDPDDPAFAKPTKPIGRFLPREEAAVLVEHGEIWEDRGAKGWRRVVPSPEPSRCLDGDAARVLLEAGYVVTSGGGGGIPVVPDGAGYRGVEAVIDKDLTAAVLADSLGADALIIATDVDAVLLGWETANPVPLGAVRVGELRKHIAADEFPSGSMLPKVEAACRFAESGGERFAVITSLELIEEGLAGRAGTVITAS
jgi:carbamate kinase